MKKIKTLSVVIVIMAITSTFVACSNSMLGTVFSGGTIANAFTSKNLLAKAGGEVAATKIESEIKPYYDKLGISVTNTYAVFDENNQYTVCVGGKKFCGTYTFDEEEAKITMKALIFNINCYAKREYGGIALLFESKKLLTVLQTLATFSSDETYKKFAELSKNYEGIRIGFDMKKQ